MIQANELRTGNWYNHNGEYCQVSPNTILEVWESPRKWVQPIPLTPEILEKCGFEQHKEYYLLFGMITQNGKNRFTIWLNDCSFSFNTERLSIKLSYLHQLQNLYWCLTGEELTFKP